MVKVSVVMPIFNSEKYLEDSIMSVLNQTIDDIEFICVDDGSSDTSLAILREYENNYNNIKVISQTNKGPGGARNTGLFNAKGEFVYFIDSDDLLKTDTALEELYDISKSKNLDLLIFPLLNYNNQTNELFETDYFKMDNLYNSVKDSIFDYNDISNILFSTCNSTCCKIYSKKFLFKNNITFPENLIFEDNVFHFNVMIDAKRIAFYNKYLYLRRHRKKSIITSVDLRYMDCFEIYDIIFDLFKKRNLFEKFKANLYNYKIFGINAWFSNIDDKYKEKFFKLIKTHLKKIPHNEEYLLNYNNRNFLNNIMKAKSYEDYLKFS